MSDTKYCLFCCFQNWKWSSSLPVSFTAWRTAKSPVFVADTAATFQPGGTLRELRQLDTLGYTKTDTKRGLWETLQPIAGHSCASVLMSGLHSDLNSWVGVDCNHKYGDTNTIICERDHKKGQEDKVHEQLDNNLGVNICRHGGILVDGTCYFVKTRAQTQGYAAGECSHRGSVIPTITTKNGNPHTTNIIKIEDILNPLFPSLTYLEVQNHPFAFWIIDYSNNNVDQCNVIQVALHSSIWDAFKVGKQLKWEVVQRDCQQMAFSICEAPATPRPQCNPGQFSCGSGECILEHSLCDNVGHCKDRSDEAESMCTQIRLKPELWFDCGNGQTIMMSKVCDLQYDCKTNLDELVCGFSKPCLFSKFRCLNKQCLSNHLHCDSKYDCLDRSDEHGCESSVRGHCWGHKCRSGYCVTHSKVNDLIPDCADESDEPHLLNTAKNAILMDQYYGLGNTKHPCKRGHSFTYDIAKTCLYDIDIHGEMKFCRNGAHLGDCPSWHCSNSFKCPAAYCIPWRKVCDGTPDCPDQTDEHVCESFTCKGLFKCRSASKMCIHPSEVCDGEVHCPEGDDEILCWAYKCPKGCTCLGNAVTCSGLESFPSAVNYYYDLKSLTLTDGSLESAPNLAFHKLWYLDLSNNKIESIHRWPFRSLHTVHKLYLNNNGLEHISLYTFYGLSNLHILSLANHTLKSVPLFYGAYQLEDINLSNGHISVLNSYTFSEVGRLRTLNLSNNLITYLPDGVFSRLRQLRQLILSGNEILQVEAMVFRYSSYLQSVSVKSYKLCCYVPKQVSCLYQDTTATSFCYEMFTNSAIENIVWLVIVVGALEAIFITFWRCRKYGELASSMTHLLTFFDGLVLVHLFLLVVTATRYKGVFVLQQDLWRKSVVCKVFAGLSYIGYNMSVVISSIFTLEKILLFHGLMTRMKKIKRISYSILLLFLVTCIILVVLPFATHMSIGTFYSDSCFLLSTPESDEPLPVVWHKVYVILYFFYTSIVCLLVVLSFSFVCTLKRRAACVHQNLSEIDNKAINRLSRQNTAVVILNLFVWTLTTIPILRYFVMGDSIRALSELHIGIVVPLKALFDPILYVFASKEFTYRTLCQVCGCTMPQDQDLDDTLDNDSLDHEAATASNGKVHSLATATDTDAVSVHEVHIDDDACIADQSAELNNKGDIMPLVNTDCDNDTLCMDNLKGTVAKEDSCSERDDYL